ncbi:hypothetical protein [Glutamicibacter sp. NPDC087344]|uniref:hypothetical protein n=1 Tax=Glutamicibacter sp. NPDC087344 TaxID=3363994 RepID=UPI003824A2BC
MSSDEQLVEQCALISLGAAVRICRCTPQSPLLHDTTGPVLWGADSISTVLATPTRCDVLVGTETQAQQLWDAASRLPHARVAVLPGASQWLGEYLGLWGMRAGHGHTLVLEAQAGGVGATTLAVLLAHAGTLSGLRSLVIDLDPHSSGTWPRICAQPRGGIGWDDLAASGGDLAAHQLVETLPRLHGTAVLTWSGVRPSVAVTAPLIARLLRAARQGFDLLVVDTGRAAHPQAEVIGYFADRKISICDESSIPLHGPYVLAAIHRKPSKAQGHDARLGCLNYMPVLERAVANGDLLDALRSRRLRQQLADLRLLPAAKIDTAHNNTIHSTDRVGS